MGAADVRRPPDGDHRRRVTVPISFTGDVAGFLFDLLSDIEAVVWEADADTFAIEFINDRVADLLGYEPIDVIAVPHFWLSTIAHPDDRDELAAAQATALATGASQLTYRAISTDGTVVWLSSVARLTVDAEGRRRIRGIETDVTALKGAEEHARESEGRFRLLSDASRDSVIVQAHGATVDVNDAFCREFGWSVEEALQLEPGDYIAAESIDVLRRQFAGGPTGTSEVIGLHRSGQRRWYSAQGREAQFHGERAQVLVLTDITDLKRRETSALHDAVHDTLTGLANRAAFDRRLAVELAQREPGHVLGILFCDLNGFKDVNDTLGHAAGDVVLQECARRFQHVVRERDPVFRIGGDEFVILLPGLPADGAARITERQREKLATALATGVSVGSRTVEVGVAVGIAICPRDGAAAEELIRHADAAMYTHKRATKSTT